MYLKVGDNVESNKIIYVDHSATTFVKDEVLEEMLPYFKDSFGNPSSVYSIGRKNKEAIEKSRVKVSKVLGCKLNEIYFTSGGSESDNMIVSGIANKYKSDLTMFAYKSVDKYYSDLTQTSIEDLRIKKINKYNINYKRVK